MKTRSMNIAALMRSAALVTAVALIPATTATMAQVDGRAGPEFAKLFAVFQRVKASYVEPVEDDVLIRGAIDGMLAALDPRPRVSYYFEPLNVMSRPAELAA